MLRIEIIAVGNIKESFMQEGINEYLKRISLFAKVSITEIKEERFSDQSQSTIDKALELEAVEILKRAEGYVIVLDSLGVLLNSQDFSQLIYDKGSDNKITIIIGSSYGLHQSVKSRADKMLSFGKMTLPHQLMRLVLCEQIYRACTIKANKKYHK